MSWFKNSLIPWVGFVSTVLTTVVWFLDFAGVASRVSQTYQATSVFMPLILVLVSGGFFAWFVVVALLWAYKKIVDSLPSTKFKKTELIMPIETILTRLDSVKRDGWIFVNSNELGIDLIDLSDTLYQLRISMPTYDLKKNDGLNKMYIYLVELRRCVKNGWLERARNLYTSEK